MDPENDNLKSKTLTGMIWTFSDTIGTQVIQLIVQIILARLLLPRDFGVVGIILVFIAISNVFIDGGFSNGLIRDKETTQEDYSTVFFFNLFVSILLYIILFFSAGFISRFFDQPALESIVRVVGILLIIGALSMIQRVMLSKEINFRVQTQINVTAALFSGIIAVICALLGLGVWSLVVKMVLMSTIQTVFFIYVRRWKPSLVFSMTSFKRLFSFGSKVMLSEIITTVYENIYFLIIGATFNATTLGYFANARRLSEAAATSITTAVHKVSYPVLSTVRLDKERLKRGYRAIIKTSAYVIFPAMIGLIAVAPVLFEVVLGENWIPAIPYFQILCLGGLLYPLISINSNMLQVQGRSDLYLYLNIGIKIIGVFFISLVVFLNMGIYGLLWFSVIDASLSFMIFALYSERFVGYTFWEQLKDVSRSLIMSVVMALTILSLSFFYTEPSLLLLVVQIVTGVAVYIGLSIVFKSSEFKMILSIGYPILKQWNQKNVMSHTTRK